MAIHRICHLTDNGGIGLEVSLGTLESSLEWVAARVWMPQTWVILPIVIDDFSDF